MRGNQLLGWGRGPLTAFKQSVPLAELRGATEALKHTSGPITIVIDSSVVVNGFYNGAGFKHVVNSSAWKVFWQQAESRQSRVLKVKSHASPATEGIPGWGAPAPLAGQWSRRQGGTG